MFFFRACFGSAPIFRLAGFTTGQRMHRQAVHKFRDADPTTVGLREQIQQREVVETDATACAQAVVKPELAAGVGTV